MIIKALISKYTTSERDAAKQLIESLKISGLKNDLFLFDRGYPSFDFFLYLMDAGVKFVIRIPSNSYRGYMKPNIHDQLLEMKSNGKKIQIRGLRIFLDSGVEEILFTNLFEETFDIPAFKALYFKRWGIETKYDELKNKLQIQKFTGDDQAVIEQDFYATIFLSNMTSLVQQEADEIIYNDQLHKNLKYDCVVNRNILIGKLKIISSLLF